MATKTIDRTLRAMAKRVGIQVNGLEGEEPINAWWYTVSEDVFLEQVGALTHAGRMTLVKEIETAVRRTTTRAYLENCFTPEGGIDYAKQKSISIQGPRHRACLEAVWRVIHANPAGKPAKIAGRGDGKIAS